MLCILNYIKTTGTACSVIVYLKHPMPNIYLAQLFIFFYMFTILIHKAVDATESTAPTLKIKGIHPLPRVRARLFLFGGDSDSVIALCICDWERMRQAIERRVDFVEIHSHTRVGLIKVET